MAIEADWIERITGVEVTTNSEVVKVSVHGKDGVLLFDINKTVVVLRDGNVSVKLASELKYNDRLIDYEGGWHTNV